MLGPRRFNNKPHYLQSTLGSITTGCPPHLVAVLSLSLIFSRSPSRSSSRSCTRGFRRRLSVTSRYYLAAAAAAGRSYVVSVSGLHYFTANAQGAILNLYNQSAPTRHEKYLWERVYIHLCPRDDTRERWRGTKGKLAMYPFVAARYKLAARPGD